MRKWGHFIKKKKKKWVKGYKLWYLEDGFKRCLVSRDVVFNEAEMAYKTKLSMVQSNTDQSKETDSEK